MVTSRRPSGVRALRASSIVPGPSFPVKRHEFRGVHVAAAPWFAGATLLPGRARSGESVRFPAMRAGAALTFALPCAEHAMHARVQGNGRCPARANQGTERRGHVLPGRRRGVCAGRSTPASRRRSAGGPAPKALIAPHAGYRYSGEIAASAYVRLKPRAHEIRRVVLLGPAHYHPVRGVAAPTADSFATPLGRVPVDAAWIRRALELPISSAELDPAFEREHSLEVHLPFLMRVLPRFSVAPFLVGTAAPAEIDTLLETLWGGPETAIVISSDLSHYLDYESARRLDAKTSEAIVALRHDEVGHEQACGRHAVNGLLHLAKRRGLEAAALDVRNSGDTAGPAGPRGRLRRVRVLRAGAPGPRSRIATAPARHCRALDSPRARARKGMRRRSRHPAARARRAARLVRDPGVGRPSARVHREPGGDPPARGGCRAQRP